MKLKTLFTALALSIATSAFAADKATLKDGVDAEVKAAIEAAQKANSDVPTGFAWRDSGKQLEDAIKAANGGDNDKAKNLAAEVKTAAENGVKQAEAGKSAGPRF
ncbi:hypothetical protein [Thiothrix nivea]|uniref:SoxXA-binding protein SoxK n=1 Tax=Thiothrix nivea (strain ATCC 35100 / DSM 5205 / JP2) TaxID=870187 RepID=A0A656HBK5_THINJ|nr:hypothetical protein [Thiothrix nivea]EIJ32766.1 hypothetical protein Thini_0099 [Thiothrix nivea DSM 5205]